MTTIAERLLSVRGKAKQGDFAKALNINPNTLRNYENGRVIPNQDILERICVHFSVSPAWLLLGVGSMKADEAAAVNSDEPPVEYLKGRNEYLEYAQKDLMAQNEKLTKRNEYLEKRHDEMHSKLMEMMDKLLELKQTIPKSEPITVAPSSAPSAPSVNLTSDE